MSGKVFAFNVSKEIESLDENAREQWVGDQVALGCMHCRCTGGQNYGLSACNVSPTQICNAYGGSGYYLCDSI